MTGNGFVMSVTQQRAPLTFGDYHLEWVSCLIIGSYVRVASSSVATSARVLRRPADMSPPRGVGDTR